MCSWFCFCFDLHHCSYRPSIIAGDDPCLFNQWHLGALIQHRDIEHGAFSSLIYLINIQKTMENHHFQWVNPLSITIFNIKLLITTSGYLIKWQFPIAISHSKLLSTEAPGSAARAWGCGTSTGCPWRRGCRRGPRRLRRWLGRILAGRKGRGAPRYWGIDLVELVTYMDDIYIYMDDIVVECWYPQLTVVGSNFLTWMKYNLDYCQYCSLLCHII